MAELQIVAILYAKPGKEQELGQDLRALVGPSRTEEGNLRYDLLVDNKDPRRFVFIEHWANIALREKHHTEGKHILHFHANGVSNVERAEVYELAGAS